MGKGSHRTCSKAHNTYGLETVALNGTLNRTLSQNGNTVLALWQTCSRLERK